MDQKNLKNKFLISIITITKDDRKGLDLTLRSIKEHKENIELIIVNGSKNTGLIKYENLRKITKIKHIKIINQKKTGIFNAMNDGLRTSEGEYVIFMNGGDQFHPDFKFMEFLNIFQKNYDILIFQTLIYSSFINRDIGINPPIMKLKKKYFVFLTKLFPSIFWPSHQSCIFRSKTHKANLYEEKSIGSDEKIIKIFMKKNILTFNKICSITDTCGISSVPPKTLKSLIIQIKDSLKEKQYARIIRLLFFFVLSFFITSKEIDKFRLIKYKLANLIINIFIDNDKV